MQKLRREQAATSEMRQGKAATCETPYVPVLHTKDSFTALLTHLQEVCPHAFSMMLIINNHAITVQQGSVTLHHQPSVDTSEPGQWLDVDPNHLYDLAFEPDVDMIAQAIFKQRTSMVFGISVKMQHQHHAKVEALLSVLGANQAADFVVSADLLQMACALGDITLVRRVLDANKAAEPPVMSNEIILKKMMYAAAFNHVALVQYLLSLPTKIPEEKRLNFTHAALGEALKYGAREVIVEFLDIHPELLLLQNTAYNNQTIVMLAATNHVSLKLVLDKLDGQLLAKRRQVLQAVDVNQQDALYHARTNRASFELLLDRYLSDRELQKPFKNISALQKLIVSLMPYPAVLTVFLTNMSQNTRLKSLLKIAITDALPQDLAVQELQSHLIVVACSHYQDALKPLFSCLDEEDLTDHLQEQVGNVYDGMTFDDAPESTRLFVDVEKLSSFASGMLAQYPNLLVIELLLLVHPERLPTVLESLSESALVEILLLEGAMGSLSLGGMNTMTPILPAEVQEELLQKQDEVSETLNSCSMFDFVQSKAVREAVSRLVYANVQTPALLAQVKARISWIEEPVDAPKVHDAQLEAFKTLIPKHRVMRTWFAGLASEARLSLFHRAGSLLLHAPYLFECIISDLPFAELPAFLDVIINNPEQYLSRNMGSRSYQALANRLNSEQAHDGLKNLLAPHPLMGIVLFFVIRKEALAILWERLDAEHALALVAQVIPPSGQTMFQILLGNPDSSSWCPEDLKFIATLVKPLESSQTRALLMEHPLAVYTLKQRELAVYNLILLRLDKADRRAIKEQYNTHAFVDGVMMPRVSGSGFGTFKTLIQPCVEEHSDDEEELDTSIRNVH
jgi:hypothetical protein